MFSLLATVFHLADIFSASGYSIYFLLFLLLIIIMFCVLFLLWLTFYYVIDAYCVRFFGSVAWMYTMWAVHFLSALVSWAHLYVLRAGCLNDNW